MFISGAGNTNIDLIFHFIVSLLIITAGFIYQMYHTSVMYVLYARLDDL